MDDVSDTEMDLRGVTEWLLVVVGEKEIVEEVVGVNEGEEVIEGEIEADGVGEMHETETKHQTTEFSL